MRSWRAVFGGHEFKHNFARVRCDPKRREQYLPRVRLSEHRKHASTGGEKDRRAFGNEFARDGREEFFFAREIELRTSERGQHDKDLRAFVARDRSFSTARRPLHDRKSCAAQRVGHRG